MSAFRASSAKALPAAAFAAVCFIAGGGTSVGRSTTAYILIVGCVGVAFALLALRPDARQWLIPREPTPGMGVLGLFAALVALSALSGAWSLEPDATYTEGARLLALLATFAAAVVGARLFPDAGPRVATALLTVSVVVCGWALVTRVFPGTLAELVIGPRLSAPLGYWNALGGLAAMGLPIAAWRGTRRDASPLTRATAYPAVAVLVLCLLLTQSRGALIAGLVALAVWTAFAPRRLRTVATIGLPTAVVAPVALWALPKEAFSEQLVPLAAREEIAAPLGAMALAVITVSLAIGLVVDRLAVSRPLGLTARKRLGTVAVVVAAAVLPAVGLASLAVSDRGLGGSVSDGISNLTDEKAGGPPTGSARFGSTESARPQYWRQALRVFGENKVVGTGANSFGVARLPYRRSPSPTTQAHGFLFQTAADLGMVGLLLVLALLIAWVRAAARTLELRGRRTWDGQRCAHLALAGSVLAFGLQSATDWTWFVPAPALAALIAAGFVAGRGPLGETSPRRIEPGGRLGGLLPSLRPSALHGTAAAACLLITACLAWGVWQPQASERAVDRVYDELAEGDEQRALASADAARRANPYSPQPVFAKSDVYAASGRTVLAYRALEQAVIEHPRDPETWLTLAQFELEELDLPLRASSTVAGAFRADPQSQPAARLAARVQAAR